MLSLRCLAAACMSLALVACNTVPAKHETVAATAAAHDNLNAVLWMQSAAEYEATTRGVYAAARSSLDLALADPAWNALPEDERQEGFESLPPAIIVDADETMIDNSPFQVRAIRDGKAFVYADWLAWVNERRARALPGAVEFANAAAAHGVTIYFITNRDAPAETEGTIANLRALGFPIADDGSNVMLRGDVRGPGREKSARRRWVGARHRVVLMLGDNLGDFMDGVNVDIAARQALIAPHASWWGVRWFMQPNPSYGSWESAAAIACESIRAGTTRLDQPDSAKLDPHECKRSLLRAE